MLGVRGISLGLGKINLNDLNSMATMERGQMPRMRRKKPKLKPNIKIKKYVDKKTLWTACRTVIFAGILIGAGIIMTGVGFFDKDFSKKSVYNQTLNMNISTVDSNWKMYLKGMQYAGPIATGAGAFLLIVACVITLESRDKHTLVIQTDALKNRKKIQQLNLSDDNRATLAPIAIDEQYSNLGVSENTVSNARDSCCIDIDDLDDECFEENEEGTPMQKMDSKYLSQQSTVDVQDDIKKKNYSPGESFKLRQKTRKRSMFNFGNSKQNSSHSVSVGNLNKEEYYENRDLYAELLTEFYDQYSDAPIKDIALSLSTGDVMFESTDNNRITERTEYNDDNEETDKD
uniref:Ion_trans_2 domain-containing protein n=1 Tax=Rhabditophanes sp. KR3021 TaxID=114890 RepID=A0AC35TSQ6_9BILA